jgi:hypothetical protein
MSTIRPLELSDRLTVEDYLRRYPPEISELTFTNLFVWRHSRPVFLAEVEDSIVFVTNTGEDGDGESFILGYPIGGASLLGVANALGVDVAGFIRVPENTASTLRDSNLLVTPDRNNSDYVYRVTDLAELAGRRFHKKRNLIKQCLTAYTCEYEALTPELIAECSDMQDRWCKVRQCGQDPGLCSEYVAIRNVFDHFEDLYLIGGAIRVDGLIQAYAVGEELRPGTAVCHFEKAMPGLRGLGQLINQWFAKYALRDFEFENREQDLGIPGLRQAKESYYPHHMVEKFSAWFSTARSDIALPVEPRECEKHGVDEA